MPRMVLLGSGPGLTHARTGLSLDPPMECWYGVVVQADPFLPRSVVLVAPTSTRAKPASFRPEVEVDGAMTRVLVEHTGTVDVNRLGHLIGRLTP